LLLQLSVVIPAKAGMTEEKKDKIPAFAGMTEERFPPSRE
jgi:hypothetical protein